MRAPIELHKKDRVWRRAWQLVNKRKVQAMVGTVIKSVSRRTYV